MRSASRNSRQATRRPTRYAAATLPDSRFSTEIAQRDLERRICRRHVVEVERVGLHPEKLLSLTRRDRALPAPAEIDRHEQVEIGIGVACEGERGEVLLGDGNAELLAKLADYGVLGFLARLDLAAGELP